MMQNTVKQQIREEFAWLDHLPDVVREIIKRDKIRVVKASKDVGEFPNFLTRVTRRKVRFLGHREIAVLAAALGKSREEIETLAKQACQTCQAASLN
jgi:hypothetical protein